MKHLILITLTSMLLVACTQEPVVVPFDSLQDRQGIKYQVNSQEPFTGIAESYYENGQLESKDCYKNSEITDMSYCEK